MKNPSKIREWQNCTGTPTVKTRSKIQTEKKAALKSQNEKTVLLTPQSKPTLKSKLSKTALKSKSPKAHPKLKSPKTHPKSENRKKRPRTSHFYTTANVLKLFASNLRSRVVKHRSDNQSIIHILTVGNKKPALYNLATNVFNLCIKNNIQLISEWVP